MIKVGKRKKTDDPKKIKLYSYLDIKFDADGWANAQEYLPADFELVLVHIGKRKTQCGWINGKKWDGLKIDPNDKVIAWKRRTEICH